MEELSKLRVAENEVCKTDFERDGGRLDFGGRVSRACLSLGLIDWDVVLVDLEHVEVVLNLLDRLDVGQTVSTLSTLRVFACSLNSPSTSLNDPSDMATLSMRRKQVSQS
jgi:hypothetical protein